MTKEKSSEASGHKVIAVNRKARFEYHIIETVEAGIVLTGAEIKSVRNGGLSIAESYVRPGGGNLHLLGAHIKAYSHASSHVEYDPVRARKLLLHKHEIEKLTQRVEAKGCTLVPLQAYLKGGYLKIEIALAKGKDNPDKRQSIKEREGKREAARAMRRNG
jgi:SsrA-binding protein